MKLSVRKNYLTNIYFTNDNGDTLSVAFGYGAYCSNYNSKEDTPVSTIEFAVMNKNNEFVTKQFMKEFTKRKYDDTVVGYYSVEDLDKLLKKFKKFKGDLE